MTISTPAATPSTSKRPSTEDRRLAEATKTLRAFHAAMEANDAEAVGRCFARDPDMVSFGTDRAERWVGYDTLMESLGQQLAAFQTTSMSIRDQVVHLSASGDVAWFSEILDWNIRAGDDAMALEGLRVTGVLEQRGGEWLAVQLHVSKGVEGQAVEY